MSTNPVVLNTPAVNDELTRAIHSAVDAADIRAAVIAEAEKQTAAKTADAAKTEAEKETARVAAEAAAAAAAPKTFSRLETIGGKEFSFEAASELELERMVTNAYKVASAVQTQPERVEVVDPSVAAAAAQKASEERVAQRAELALQFKRGDIDAGTYIEQSGALDDYLVKKGIPIEALKAAVDQTQNSSFTKSWEQATQEFLHSAAGADWPGGEQNLKIIGLKVAELGLVETDDKVGALAQAFHAMKAENIVFPGAAPAKTAEQIAAEAAAATRTAPPASTTTATPAATTTQSATQTRTSSSLFGASSGTGAATEVKKTDETKFEIPANASPAEIMDAWKKQQLATGKDPNAEFQAAFSGRK